VGCYTLPAGDSIFFQVETENDNYVFGRTLFWDLDPGSYLGGTVAIADSLIGDFKKFTATFIYPTEELLDNNSFEGEISSIGVIRDGYFEDFTPEADESLFFLETNTLYVQDSIYEFNGNNMLAISGIRTTANYTNCDEVEDFFDQYRRQSILRYCVDAEGMEEPYFSFNYVHFINEYFYQDIANEAYGSMFRIVTDSTSSDIIYGDELGSIHEMEFSLPQNYAGIVEIEMVTLSGTQAPFENENLENLDVLLLDNIRLYDKARIDKLFADDEFILFPNPSNSWVQIENKDLNSVFDLEIHDMLGRLVLKYDNIQHKKLIDVSDYAPGMYYVTIWQEERKTFEHKLIKTD